MTGTSVELTTLIEDFGLDMMWHVCCDHGVQMLAHRYRN